MKKSTPLFLFLVLNTIGFVSYSCKDDDQTTNIYEGCCAIAPVEMDFNPGKIYIPNMFTPNGDGINDIFIVHADDGVEEFLEFIITDEEDDKLFEFYNFTPNVFAFGWDSVEDGSTSLYNGKFKYHLKLRNSEGNVFEVDGNACSFVCDETNPFDDFENCGFGAQHNGFGEFDTTIPSLEQSCQ